MRHLILIRGLPGSGKSTLAKQIKHACGYFHIEADMFWIGVDGSYNFDITRLEEAHQWCQCHARDTLKYQDVVVSNTFTRIREMQPYLDMTNNVTVLTCTASFGSIHNVPHDVLIKMRDRWEAYP